MNEKLLKLAFDYIYSISSKKRYNIQSMAILNYFNIKENQVQLNKDFYLGDYKLFKSEMESLKVKDFTYKNDYFTPREMYLIPPSYYLYYTFQVFKLCYEFYGKSVINFSTEHNKIFYSGELDLSNNKKSNIDKKSDFSYSYNSFQDRRKDFDGNRVLVADVQDFFKGIKTEELIDKIKIMNGVVQSDIVKYVIENLSSLFADLSFFNLPQLNFSIASSILSQLYLGDFSNKMESILSEYGCWAVRFVDDMYIQLPNTLTKKEVNAMLDKLSFHLWKEGLNFNTSKTEILGIDEYKKFSETVIEDYDDIPNVKGYKKSKFVSQKIIADKVGELIESDGVLLIEFISKLNKLADDEGVDFKKYHQLENDYLSINGNDSGKVFNNLLYGRRWEELSPSNIERVIANSSFIYFDPSKYTVFYILLNRHVEDIKRKKLRYIKTMLNRIFAADEFTFRECAISISYLLQNKTKHSDLMNKLSKVNSDYATFIYKYIDF